LPAIIIANVEPTYILSRETYNREASSKVRARPFLRAGLARTDRTSSSLPPDVLLGSLLNRTEQVSASLLAARRLALFLTTPPLASPSITVCAEMPLSIICAVAFFLVFYFPCVCLSCASRKQ
jgi:hypothetical protein